MSRYKAYPAYKDSGVACLGRIPPHWAISKLRYKFAFGKGLTITKENLVEDGIPCVNYGEVHSKFGFEVNPTKHLLKCVDESYLKAFSSCLLRKGDFVFADTSEDLDGSGNFTQLTSDTVTFAGYHTIIARPESRKNTRYLAYLFDAKEFRTQIRLAVKGVKVFSITQAILRGADIWLPSDDEQKNIAAFLDHETAKIDALIEKQQRLIELLKEKRQAVISHAVTKGLNPNAPMKDSGVEWLGEVPAHWEVMRLKHLATNIKAGPFGSAITKDMYVSAGYRVYGQEQVIPEDFSIGDYYISAETFLSLNQYKVTAGDILISCVGTFGKIAVVPPSIEPGIINPRLIRFQCNEHITPSLLAIVLRSAVVFEQFAYLSRGGTMDVINIGTLSEINVVIPPLNEQDELVAHVTTTSIRFDALIGKAESAISLLQERRTALISAAVTGKIDVRDWQATT